MGFHAYENKEDAMIILSLFNFIGFVVVVKLHNVFLKGEDFTYDVLVAKQCTFLEILENPNEL
jgi:hypothetical protein